MPEIKTRGDCPEIIMMSRNKAYWSPDHEKIDAANFLALKMDYKYFRGLTN